MTTVFEAIVLGAAQGLTEFFPVSSSAHLFIIPKIFNWTTPPLAFDVALHVATLLAIVIALKSDIARIITESLRGDVAHRRLIFTLAVASIPVFVIGALASNFIHQVQTLPVIIGALIVWSIILAVADIFSESRRQPSQKEADISLVSWAQAIGMGLAQAAALIPGTSRSGAILAIGLLTGLTRSQAARYAFLLGIPAIAGAALKSGYDVYQGGLQMDWLPLFMGMLTAALVGVATIKLFFRFLNQGDLDKFVYYRLALAVFLMLFL